MSIIQSVRLRHFYHYGYRLSINVQLDYVQNRDIDASWDLVQAVHVGSNMEVPEDDPAWEELQLALESCELFDKFFQSEAEDAMKEDFAENLWPVPEERETQQ